MADDSTVQRGLGWLDKNILEFSLTEVNPKVGFEAEMIISCFKTELFIFSVCFAVILKTLCRSTFPSLICKQSFAMASNRSRRLTADQARELFRNLHDEESENSLDKSDSDFSSNESILSNCSQSQR